MSRAWLPCLLSLPMQMSVDGTHFVTASNDKSAKLVDTQTLQARGLEAGASF